MSFERRPVHKDSKDKRVATTADNCRQLIQSGACSFPGDCGTDAEYLRHSSRTCAEPRRPSNQPKLAPRRRIDTYRDRSKSLSSGAPCSGGSAWSVTHRCSRRLFAAANMYLRVEVGHHARRWLISPHLGRQTPRISSFGQRVPPINGRKCSGARSNGA